MQPCVMAEKKKRTQRKQFTWRDNPDDRMRNFQSLPRPESLHPTETTMMLAASGDPEKIAIVDSWAFRFPVMIGEVYGSDYL